MAADASATAAPNNVFYSTIDKLIQSGVPILVTDPRRVGEGREVHVQYLIQIEGYSVRRRFSEFDSFRELLVRLNPTCIVPPLPEKEGITLSAVSFNLLASSTAPDHESIEKRRVHLQSFLNRVAKHPILSACRAFHRFLEADFWGPALTEESKAVEVPSVFGNISAVMNARVERPDARFLDIQNHNNKFAQQVGALERNMRRLVRRQTELGGDYAELGSLFQSLAQNEKELSQALSKTGEAVDGVFLGSRYLVSELDTTVMDPLQEYLGFVNSLKAVMKVQEQRQVALEALMDQLQTKRDQLKNMELQLAGQPVSEPLTSSIFRKISVMLDSNPSQTLRDNISKLQTSVQEFERMTDEANSISTKSSEAILNDYQRYSQAKAQDFKAIMLSYAKNEIDFHHKNAALWENVVPVIDKTTFS